MIAWRLVLPFNIAFRVFSACLVLSMFAALAITPSFATRRHSHAEPQPPLVFQPPLIMGSLMLQPCPYAPEAYCGTMPRALDPTGTVPGTIDIFFELDPHTDTTQQPLEPLIFQEGGPGSGSTYSRFGFLALAGPLRRRHDVIMMDTRGTGRSQAIDCPAAQNDYLLTQYSILQCGDLLLDSADLYGTHLAADDLSAILDALSIDRIDLYGDSYGTFFGGTFSALHPNRLRALVLDGAYAVKNNDPWWPQVGVAMRYALNAACKRSANCASLPGNALERLTSLVEQVRANPVGGTAQDGEGVPRRVRIDPVSLAYLGTSDALYYPLTREMDPAVRALQENGDALPMLRLISENEAASFSGSPGSNPMQSSSGLYLAVTCQDYPQIYDLRSPFEGRLVQRTASFVRQRKLDPNIYFPFTLDEYAAVALDYSLLDQCITWPAPAPAYPPAQPIPPNAKFTKAPVLVLNGDMDTLTPVLEGVQATRDYDHAQQVITRNTFHVSAIGDEDDCAQAIVRRFIENLDPGDTSCAAKIAEVRVAPKFATASSQLDPLNALPGNQGTASDLQVAAAAAYAMGDVLDLYWANYTGTGVGLRGGTWSYASDVSGSKYWFTMNQVRWTQDVAVSGQFTWDYYKPGAVQGTLSVTGPGGEDGEITITFNSREPDAQAIMTGRIGGRHIAAGMYAP